MNGRQRVTRDELLAELDRVGRVHSDATVMFHSAVAAEVGLGVTDEKLLSLLERNGPSTAGDLARVAGLAPSSLTSALDRLEAKRFITRRRDPDDQRRVVVEVQPHLFETAAPLFAGLAHHLDVVYSRCTDDELSVILDYLQRVSEALRIATTELAENGTTASQAVRQATDDPTGRTNSGAFGGRGIGGLLITP
jgi:DNA-binding MarR family transcriptional regulator